MSGFAVLAALLLGAALVLPVVLELVLSLGERSARRPLSDLVLGRQPPATVRAVAGADGAAAGARGQCRRRHHGREFQPDLPGWLDGRLAADIYVNAARRRAGARDQGVAARTSRGRGDPARRPRRCAIGGRADRGAGPAPITPPIATTGRCWNRPPNAWDQAASRRRGAGQRATVAAAEARRSATASTCRRPAATGRSRSSASMPITATRRARSRSISPR